jgi:hypothetical protein
MSDTENRRMRNLTYSFWHRIASLRRFMSEQEARFCSMLDCDCIEYRDSTSQPLALVETALDTHKRKHHSVLKALARAAGLPAYVVLYQESSTTNPANNYHGPCPVCGNKLTNSERLRFPDIEKFSVQQIEPVSKGRGIVEYSPGEWAQKILSIHKQAEK